MIVDQHLLGILDLSRHRLQLLGELGARAIHAEARLRGLATPESIGRGQITRLAAQPCRTDFLGRG
jgi:hypothetical protein